MSKQYGMGFVSILIQLFAVGTSMAGAYAILVNFDSVALALALCFFWSILCGVVGGFAAAAWEFIND